MNEALRLFFEANLAGQFCFFVCLIIVAGIVAKMLAFMVVRPFRSRDIQKHGWPPPHCDADGDFKKEKDDG